MFIWRVYHELYCLSITNRIERVSVGLICFKLQSGSCRLRISTCGDRSEVSFEANLSMKATLRYMRCEYVYVSVERRLSNIDSK
jgi:hypothetical protein